MNFQEARNLEGQKNAKGYQMGVKMPGTVMALIDIKRVFTTNGKPTQQIHLQDSLGETQKVKIFLGNGPDILQTDVTTKQQFTDLAMNRFKGHVTYMAFWDNMHPPQTHLNPQTQAIIDEQFQSPTGQQAASAVMDYMGGQQSPNITRKSYTSPPQTSPPTQQDYEAKDRKKAIGMCMHGYLVAEIGRRPLIELFEDKATLQAAYQLGVICVDGMAQVVDSEPNF